MISPELLALLRCPETKQPVHIAPPELLERLSNAHGGARIEAGLVREDGRVLYPVRNGIPIMLVEEAISLEPV